MKSVGSAEFSGPVIQSSIDPQAKPEPRDETDWEKGLGWFACRSGRQPSERGSRHVGLGISVPQPTRLREIWSGSRALTLYLFSKSANILEDSGSQTVSLRSCNHFKGSRPVYFKSGTEKKDESRACSKIEPCFLLSVKYSIHCVH